MIPAKVEHDLKRTPPEHQGIASSAVLQFVQKLEESIRDIHSFMLLRHGIIVAEGWWSPYKREYPHIFFSLTKSFTSTAVGLAVNEGYFSIDDAVVSFFPDETPADASDLLKAMRVRHLLSMSTGHADDTWTPMVERQDNEWVKGFLELPIKHEPGTQFLYNTGASYVLAAIVQKTTGMKMIDFLMPRLFEPLGIERPTWLESPEGITVGGFGLSAQTDVIARFGQLYLQKGMWDSKQIIPEAWIEEATRSHISNGNDPDSEWSQGYGFQFWRCRHGAYRGDGAFGQYCVIMPEQDAVLAITSGLDDMQKPLDLLWSILLPAMESDPLDDDPESHQRLTEKLSTLNIAPLTGQTPPTITSAISERLYGVDINGLEIETIRFNFTESGCTVKVKTHTRDATIPCGYGVWERGQTNLFNEWWDDELKPTVTSGAWTADDTFTMVVRLVETPFMHTVTFSFVGEELMVEIRVNVSFGSLKPVLLTGRSI